ncbi:oxygen-independent coproporphyrinogen-3 oxidase [Lachnospiraceae bacterium C7]|nr:oxygen-independent coproporphyrinogen-3 oxidase [Lachnospiraceae bacterium C7]
MKELEIYVHIPFCVKKCDYCDFLSFPANEKTQREYKNALIQEIRHYGSIMKEREVTSIFFGGGTPSWLDCDYLVQILEAIKESFTIRKGAEITMEANPGTVTERAMKKYFQAGINRLSIGLQSTNDDELKLLGRIHTYDQFLKIYTMARECGFTNINVDLMSGLPYQTIDKFLKSLNEVIRLKPEHVSSYSLIIEKGTPFYERYRFDDVKQHAGMETEYLPSEDDTYRMYKLTQSYLKEAGYMQYETSNFAKKGLECKHNVGYWTRKDYLGVGLGASSLINNIRYSNITSIYDYVMGAMNIQLLEMPEEEKLEAQKQKLQSIYSNLHESVHSLSVKEQIEEFMFLGLRMNAGVSRDEFQENFGVPIESTYGSVMDKLKKEGLLKVQAGRVFLTDKGSDLANYCMAQFM